MVLPKELEDCFGELSALEPGWDGDDAVPMKPIVLKMARGALTILFSDDPDMECPDIGAVEDGRFDIYWGRDTLDVFLTLDENDIRIHARENIPLRDIPLEGDDYQARVKFLVDIIREETQKGLRRKPKNEYS